MAFDLKSISKGKAERAPRIIMLGIEKIGKSSFAAGSDNPIFLPVRGEEGIDALDVDSFPPAASPDDVLKAIASLYKDKHEYKTIVIDSASALEPLVVDAAVKQEDVDSPAKLGGGYGRQDDTPLAMWKQITDGLDALRNEHNMASIIIGHVIARTFNDPTTEPYDTYEWDVGKKLRNMLFRWADCILFANRKALVKKDDVGFNKDRHRGYGDDRPVLYTRKRPAHPGGGRGVYGQLPYELELTWPAFIKAVGDASDK